MYTLHIANKNYSSWSLRIYLLMKQLGIPFVEKNHYYQPNQNHHSEFKQISPVAKVPVLELGNELIWDSLAITEYLAESYPAVWPVNKQARAWARSASAEMHSGFMALRNQCGMFCSARATLKQMPEDLNQDMQRINQLWQQGLERFSGPFLAGKEFTAVDAFFAPVIFRIQTYNLPLDKACEDYYHRMLNLPEMQNWYQAALTEGHRLTGQEDQFKQRVNFIVDYQD